MPEKASSPPETSPVAGCAMVIFGAVGDLTKRLLVPALYNLARTGALPENFALIGVDHNQATAGSWADDLHARLETFVGNAGSEFDIDSIDEAAWARLAGRMSYVQGDFAEPALYASLQGALQAARAAHATGGNVIFYLAVSDRFFGPIVDQLGKAKLTDQRAGKDGFWRRVVIEKPFGDSLASARALNARILRTLVEDQIFRIDHFLGKTTVQNIMAFRFANGLFEPIWNRDRIDHVQITAAETVGVEERGQFYEATGALRDMIPNHVFSLLTLVAMEPPMAFDATAIRSRKTEVFSAMPAVRPEAAVRGQYRSGVVLGKPVKAYREEPMVAAQSNIETFVAMRLEIDNWRWAGVPFYVRTGKHMSQRATEIAICFKQAPFAAFKGTPVAELSPNWLVLRVAPDEGISLQFEVNRPGSEVELAAVKMDFQYGASFGRPSPEAYERLILDAMQGDATLFARNDEVEEAWKFVEAILNAWEKPAKDQPPLTTYPAGSPGPVEADEMLARDGRAWRRI